MCLSCCHLRNGVVYASDAERNAINTPQGKISARGVSREAAQELTLLISSSLAPSCSGSGHHRPDLYTKGSSSKNYQVCSRPHFSKMRPFSSLLRPVFPKAGLLGLHGRVSRTLQTLSPAFAPWFSSTDKSFFYSN